MDNDNNVGLKMNFCSSSTLLHLYEIAEWSIAGVLSGRDNESVSWGKTGGPKIDEIPLAHDTPKGSPRLLCWTVLD